MSCIKAAEFEDAKLCATRSDLSHYQRFTHTASVEDTDKPGTPRVHPPAAPEPLTIPEYPARIGELYPPPADLDDGRRATC